MSKRKYYDHSKNNLCQIEITNFLGVDNGQNTLEYHCSVCSVIILGGMLKVGQI